MYTVFISDDAESIREGLKRLIDWGSLGFGICGEAGDGSETLSRILMKQPNLVILDIKMPHMHGIDVIKEARTRGFSGKFILLSGYSDFGYAQTAMRYGVDFYLTKPVDEDELLQAVSKIKEVLDDENLKNRYVNHYKKRAKNVILQELLTNTAFLGDSGVTQEDLDALSPDADIFQVVIYSNFNTETSVKSYDFAELLRIINKDNRTFEYVCISNMDVILLKGEFALKKFGELLKHYDAKQPQEGSPLDAVFIVYGQPVCSLTDIHLSYHDAVCLINRRFFCVQGQHTLGYEELPSLNSKDNELSDEILKSYVSQITDHLQTSNRIKTNEALSRLSGCLYNVKDGIPKVKLFLADLYLQIKANICNLYHSLDFNFPTNSEIIDLIDKKYYLYEIIDFLSEQFEMIMGATGSSGRENIIDDIIYYIEHNYRNNIKLESIAPLFDYNSAYLGKKFSKTMGVNFNHYVDFVRVERAKELILQNKLKIYEISEMVGYKNVDYFHKKFKKFVGMTPAEYGKTQCKALP